MVGGQREDAAGKPPCPPCRRSPAPGPAETFWHMGPLPTRVSQERLLWAEAAFGSKGTLRYNGHVI